jgi:hypothetical protein
MNSEEDLQREIKELKARLLVLENYIFKKQEPFLEEDDERDQCWGCGKYVDTGEIHNCH